MQFTHETTVMVDYQPADVLAHWQHAEALPRHLSHVRAVASGDDVDVARLIVALEGRHIEFVVQRTMCTESAICWQSVGDTFLYVLSVEALRVRCADMERTAVHVTVSYDPPGFLPDVLESLGRSRIFKHALDADVQCYGIAHRGSGAPAVSLRA